MGKKKEQVHQRLDLIARERREVDSQLASKATELDSVKSKPVLKGEDFRKYATELRGKTAQYKRMKARPAPLRPAPPRPAPLRPAPPRTAQQRPAISQTARYHY